MVEEGEVVEVHYTGRIGSTGEVFDLTSEDSSEVDDDVDLGPVKVLVGAGHVIPGLDDVLKEMEEGEEREVEISAERAFGERDSDEVETLSSREFDRYDVTPRRGLVVEIDGRRGKIISTSSGRVRVDFNHPMAGKDVEYEVEIIRVIEDPVERVEAVLEYYGLEEAEHDYDGREVSVTLPEGVGNEETRTFLGEELKKVKGVEEVDIN